MESMRVSDIQRTPHELWIAQRFFYNIQHKSGYELWPYCDLP